MNVSPSNRSVRRGYLSWWIWIVYAVLFVIGVPWYWPASDATVWLGMPAWVVVSLAVSVVVSLFTAGLLWWAWPEEDETTGMETTR